MRTSMLAAIVFAVAGCGRGLAESEVNPSLEDSANPEVNPVVDLDVPVSVLGLGGAVDDPTAP